MNYHQVFQWDRDREYGFILQVAGEPLQLEEFYDPSR